MHRQILTFDSIPYLVEHIRSSELNIKPTKNFVMLRNYEILNDVAIDKEIYFIEREQYKNLFNTDNNVFVQLNNKYKSFTSDIFDIFPNSTKQSLNYEEDTEDVEYDLKKDYYNLYNKDGEIANVNCDLIRIYRPHNRIHKNSIIDISNYINNINFHYFCRRYEDLKINISKEVQYNGNIYYEYIEFHIPSVESLFGKSNISFNEDLNFYQTKYLIRHLVVEDTELHIDDKVLLNKLITPYMIDKVCNKDIECVNCDKFEDCKLKEIKNYNVKTFIVEDLTKEDYVNSDYNFINIPLILTLTHYDILDETTNKYLSLEGISPSSIILSDDNTFSIAASLDFDINNRSVISIISRFNYPKIKINNKEEILSIQDAYFYFNKITNTEEYWNFEGYDDEVFLDGLSDEFIESLKFNSAGYVVEMSLNTGFDQVFYRRSVGAKEIDDFAFNLDNIFSDWKEYPEVIFIRTIFIDKFLSKIYYSNILPFTKEKFKYTINETNNYRVSLKDMQEFKFIDKINCTVKKYDVMKENIVAIGGTNKSGNIIYKTIFYKTQDSQNIKLRNNVVQNIGINLGDYLTKIVTFKLRINNYEFTECGRQDVYVLFKVAATQIEEITGKYDIFGFDQNNDELYITSGNYTIL